MNLSTTIAALQHAPGRLLATTGSLAGNLIGGFLGGIEAARQGSLAGAYHEAARKDSTTSDWRVSLTSADQSLLGELDTMLARSRHAVVNDGWAASSQSAYDRYVVGAGITARSAARNPIDEKVGLLRSFNTQTDRLWEERCLTPELLDAEGTKIMAEKQRVWMNELFTAGGLFVLAQYSPHPDAVRLLLQEIEYEQRDTIRMEHDGHPVRGGIELGDRHQPLAYWLHTAKHPLDDYATDSKRYEASQVHHLYRQDRIRQRIGAPWMRPVLARLRQLAMYERYTMLQARTRAAYPGFIKQAVNSGPAKLPDAVARQFGVAPAADAGSEQSNELRINLAPGVMPILDPGQEPFFPTPSTPDTMYPPFVTEHLKGISAGAGLDFATVSRWYADANFSAQRQGRLDIFAEIDYIQDVLFIQKICRADRNQWMTLNVLEGRLQAPHYLESAVWRTAYQATNWQGPPRNSIDEIKDEAAWDLKIKSGRASPQEYCNAHGKSLEEVLAEIKEFRQMAVNEGLGDVVDNWFGSFVQRKPKAGMKPDDPTAGDDDPAATGATAGSGGLGELIVRKHILQGLLDDGDS